MLKLLLLPVLLLGQSQLSGTFDLCAHSLVNPDKGKGPLTLAKILDKLLKDFWYGSEWRGMKFVWLHPAPSGSISGNLSCVIL